jgi:SSS family solute:Na+ symporter
MMQAWWVFCLCSVLYVAVSLLTPAPSPEQVDGLTWGNPLSVIFGDEAHTAMAPRVMAGILLATMAVLYFIFR